MKLVSCLVPFLVVASSAMAQKVALRGQVIDESGALIPAARVVLNGPAGLTKQTRAGGDGSYLFADLTPGTYTAKWSGESFPSGVYYYRLETGGFSEVKKMILEK